MTVEAQAKELVEVRRKVICERCRKGNTGAPQTIASPRLNTAKNTSRPQNLNKPSTSRGLVQQTHRSTQPTTLIQEPQAHSTTTPTQFVSHTTSQPSDIAITHPNLPPFRLHRSRPLRLSIQIQALRSATGQFHSTTKLERSSTWRW
jgi:hypothetical protein